MSKNRLVIIILAIFLLLGTTSLALGDVSDGTYKTHIGQLYVDGGNAVVFLKDIPVSNGGPGRVHIDPNSANKDNIYTTLNSAFWGGSIVNVVVKKGLITTVFTG
jgi:hypothetical protein